MEEKFFFQQPKEGVWHLNKSTKFRIGCGKKVGLFVWLYSFR